MDDFALFSIVGNVQQGGLKIDTFVDGKFAVLSFCMHISSCAWSPYMHSVFSAALAISDTSNIELFRCYEENVKRSAVTRSRTQDPFALPLCSTTEP